MLKGNAAEFVAWCSTLMLHEPYAELLSSIHLLSFILCHGTFSFLFYIGTLFLCFFSLAYVNVLPSC